MPVLRQTMTQDRWLRWWLTLSFSVMFSGVLLFNSRTALLNVVDVLFFLPSLTLLTRALVSGDYKLLGTPLLIPLYLFLGWALLSMTWAEQPNSSRTVRGVIQIVIMVGLFRWIHLYFPHTFKKSLANGALTAVIVATAVMVSYYTTQPLQSPLFSEPTNLIFDMPSLERPEALMTMLLPTFILLAQGIDEGANGKGARRLIGAAVGGCFLILTSAPLGLMCLCLALVWLAARRHHYWLAAVPALAALYFLAEGSPTLYPDHYLSRPWIGNGLDQETLNGVIAQNGQQLQTLAHPQNLYLLTLHTLGVVGLVLFLATWITPVAALLRQRINPFSDSVFVAALVPGLLMAFAAGAYLLVPFHASWMTFWVPLALVLARLSDRARLQPIH